MIHECTNAEVLETSEQSLKTVLKDLEAGCESASGIILTSDTTKTGNALTDLPGKKNAKRSMPLNQMLLPKS